MTERTAESPVEGPTDSFDRQRMLQEVGEGLRRPQKELSPKYFYDARGSRLFERITRLPEYYLTRAERGLLLDHAGDLVAEFGPATLVELGAGNAEKSRILLDAMVASGTGRVYVPVDVSATFLASVAAVLRQEYPSLEIRPAPADITERLALPDPLPEPVMHALLGSTIGNFEPRRAAKVLRHVHFRMDAGDTLLLGVDLHKEPQVLEAAYNDSRGVTAEFNLNILSVLNRRLGADFDLEGFRHRAIYDAEHGRIEMHLIALTDQQVRIPDLGTIDFQAGESIHTENSHKFDRESVEAIFGEAGLSLERWISDDAELFALVVATAPSG